MQMSTRMLVLKGIIMEKVKKSKKIKLIIFLAIILVVLYKVYSNKLNDISKSMLSTE